MISSSRHKEKEHIKMCWSFFHDLSKHMHMLARSRPLDTRKGSGAHIAFVQQDHQSQKINFSFSSFKLATINISVLAMDHITV